MDRSVTLRHWLIRNPGAKETRSALANIIAHFGVHVVSVRVYKWRPYTNPGRGDQRMHLSSESCSWMV
jgi:hypothetical protein